MSDTTTDSQLCADCMHRMYTAGNELLCAKKHEHASVGFYCQDYVSEDIYEYKTYLMTDDKQSVAEKKVRYVFIWFVLMQIAGVVVDAFTAIHTLRGWLFSLLITLVWTAIIGALYYGRAWARSIINIVLIFCITGIFFRIGTGGLAADLIVPLLVVVAYNAYFLYFINADSDFLKHFRN